MATAPRKGAHGSDLAWRDVTPSAPCPKCGRGDWCSVSDDGAWLLCRRHNDGSGQERTDAAGQAYWLYRLKESPYPALWPEPQFDLWHGQGRRAEPDTLHKVYAALLDRLELTEAHVAALRDRGLAADKFQISDLKALGFRSLEVRGRAAAVRALIEAGLEAELPRVPGFVVKDGKEGRRYWTLAGACGLLYPIRDAERRIVALQVRADEAAGGGKYRFISSKKQGGAGSGAPVHVPVCQDRGEVVRVTEGALKADITTLLSGVLTLGLPGVGARRHLLALLQVLKPSTVRVAFDADARTNRRVALALQALVQDLRRDGYTVELETWDAEDGKGIDDLLVKGLQPRVLSGEEVVPEVKAIVAAASEADPPPAPNPAAEGLPVVIVNDRQLREVTANALEALRRANEPVPQLFQRGVELVRLKADPATGGLLLQALDAAALRGRLARVANWFREKAASEGQVVLRAVAPPKDIVQDVASLPSWDLPYLEQVIETPVFDQAGALLTAPGYHPQARLWYRRPDGLEVPDVSPRPMDAEIAEARRLLLEEVYGDFPLVDDASRAHALAATLLPFVRLLIDGPTPLHLFSAPTEGTGKTLLVSCIFHIAASRDAEPMTEARDDDEWRKRLTATLSGAPQFILLDNLNQVLRSGALASVLTTRVWKDRVLGFTREAILPVRCCWLATANNPVLSRELVRRTVYARLDAKLERPWQRPAEKYRHPRLLRWVQENRGRLVWACLTLGQAWVARGRPAGKQTLGMYESWAATIGGILETAGVPGLLDNADRFRRSAADREGEWQEFVAAWWARHADRPVGVSELFALVTEHNLLDAEVGDKGERSQRTRLGLALGRMAERVVVGKRIVAEHDDHSGRGTYRLEAVIEEAPPAAFEMEG